MSETWWFPFAFLMVAAALAALSSVIGRKIGRRMNDRDRSDTTS